MLNNIFLSILDATGYFEKYSKIAFSSISFKISDEIIVMIKKSKKFLLLYLYNLLNIVNSWIFGNIILFF